MSEKRARREPATILAETTPRIETDRLVIRAVHADDVAAFHKIASRREIALMLSSIPHPLSLGAARDWLAERVYRGEPGFSAGLYKHDRELIGCISLVNQPVTVNYFIDPKYWGQGYATEALDAFLDWSAGHFGLTEIRAGALRDNVGSHRVLEKVGFRATHVARHQSPIRPDPDLLVMFWKGFGAEEPLSVCTDRLFVHPLHPAHATRLADLGSDPEVAEAFPTFELPFTSAQAITWIAEQTEQSNVYRLAITSASGLLLGACALDIGEGSGTINGWIGRGQRRKGYGREAANGLVKLAFARIPELRQIECAINPDATSAQRMLAILGFQIADETNLSPHTRSEIGSTLRFHLSRSKVENQS